MHSITDVCRQTRLSSRTLRVWEKAALIEAQRDGSGFRTYADDIFSRIKRIQLLKDFGLSLEEIKLVLIGNHNNLLEEKLVKRQQKISEQISQLSVAQHKIKQIQTLLNPAEKKVSIELLVPDDEIVKRFEAQLFARTQTPLCAKKQNYWRQEWENADHSVTLQWHSQVRNIIHYARQHDVPLHFVRGFAPSSLSLFLHGWTQIDPVKNGLIPPNMTTQDLHFDVPYGGSHHFLEFIKTVNETMDGMKFRAFRLPILDIIEIFGAKSQQNPWIPLDESRLLKELRDGNCAKVFGLDESGQFALQRLYPELEEDQLDPKVLGEDLKRWSPNDLQDFFRFQALRREKTFDHFHDYLNTKPFTSEPSKLSSILDCFLPKKNRGYIFFREELIQAVSKLIPWSYAKIQEFRKKPTQEDVLQFIKNSDEQSYQQFRFWNERCFHKAHLCSWWQLTKLTLTCKISNESLWLDCIYNWEDEHNLKWNDFGVIYREASLLSF